MMYNFSFCPQVLFTSTQSAGDSSIDCITTPGTAQYLPVSNAAVMLGIIDSVTSLCEEDESKRVRSRQLSGQRTPPLPKQGIAKLKT